MQSAVAASPQAEAVELRDTVVPGVSCRITPAGRKGGEIQPVIAIPSRQYLASIESNITIGAESYG
ncbi:hypothetical protein CAL25_05120 [Bordetella genomosp. 5]|uniref:Uncharacterized protein n=1 Tax=Bordetella genomosp. 5 TaxID=1395608 RepID=A0A261U051_9BORD|nr:hypothetical protein CAL25_05120 [Bordetella genomosp. 5]